MEGTVRSESYLHQLYSALGNGYYCYFSTSYITFRVDVTLAHALTQAEGATVDNGNGYVRFESGPESMFRRVRKQDASGNLLETLENCNYLYCLSELLDNKKHWDAELADTPHHL